MGKRRNHHWIAWVVLLLGTHAISKTPEKSKKADPLNQVIDQYQEVTDQIKGLQCKSGCPDTLVSKPAIQGASLSGCEIRKRDPKLPLKFFSTDWHLQAIGADLVEAEGLLNGVDHCKQILGVVDTGLTSSGNPDAGTAFNNINSETFDEDGHGTHVAGISASDRFGVNRRVRVKSFQIPGVMFGSFTSQNVLKTFERASQNSDTSVINLSLSSREDGSILRAIRAATDSGKWVVYAAGNDGSVNSSHTTGHIALKNNPSVFVVGAIGPFGPSTFTNYRPDTAIFAPGFEIRSLASDYSSQLVDSNSSIDLSGTSMAAPVVSGVLATLRAIDPELKPEEARQILQMTSIAHGEKPILHQLNYYLAVKTLKNAKSCRAADAKTLTDDCIQKAMDRASSSLLSAQGILEPRPTNCDDLRTKLNELRTGFFLSKGKKEYSEAIKTLLYSLNSADAWATAALYAPAVSAKDQVTLLESFPKELITAIYEDELQHAIKFYKGELNFVSEASVADVKADGQLRKLYRLPAEVQNVNTYAEVCLDPKVLDSKDGYVCAVYLSSASKTFRKAVADLILARGKRVSSVSMLDDINPLELENGDELLRKLIPLFYQDWKNHVKPATLTFLRDNPQYFSRELRDEIVDWFISNYRQDSFGFFDRVVPKPDATDPKELEFWMGVREEGREAFADTLPKFLLLSSKKLNAQEEGEAVQWLNKWDKPKDPNVSQVRFLSYRAYFDDGQRDFAEALARFPVKAEVFDGIYLAKSPGFLDALMQDSQWAPRVVSTLQKSGRLQSFLEATGREEKGRQMMFHLLTSLSKTDPQLFKATADAFLSSKQLYLAREAIEWCDQGFTELCNIIKTSPNVIKLRREKKDTDEYYRQESARKQRALSGKSTDADFRFFRSRPEVFVGEVPGEALERDPRLVTLYQQSVRSIFTRIRKETGSWQGIIGNSSETDEGYAIKAKTLIPLMRDYVGLQTSGGAAEGGKLMEAFGRHFGRDTNLVTAIIEQVLPLIDRAYVASIVEKEKNEIVRGNVGLALKWLFDLDNTIAGRAYFNSHADIVDKISDAIKMKDGQLATLDYFLEGKRLSPTFIEPLRKRLPPSQDAFKGQTNQVAPWMLALFRTDEQSADYAVGLVNSATSGFVNEQKSNRTVLALVALCQLHPELAPKIRDKINKPEYKQVFSRFIP
jgi:hypothetical protein